jgi:hypothetical protein
VNSFASRACARILLPKLLLARLVSQSFVDILENICGPNIQGITKTIDQANAWTTFSKFDQRDVISIHSSPQSQICLAPFAFGTETTKGLPECLINVQVDAQ